MAQNVRPMQPRFLIGSMALVVVAGLAGCSSAGGRAVPTSATSTNEKAGSVDVVLTGGFEVHDDDFGRPVPLYASMLGVQPAVFRQAFSGVHPDPGHAPSAAEQEQNKVALLSVLAPHGVTNEELDQVANYYRFDSTRGETWPHRPAAATAVVSNGRIVGFTITDPGYGYSYPPRVSVPGFSAVNAVADIAFTRDFATNGHLNSITLS